MCHHGQASSIYGQEKSKSPNDFLAKEKKKNHLNDLLFLEEGLWFSLGFCCHTLSFL
jgi:hypothetical protein